MEVCESSPNLSPDYWEPGVRVHQESHTAGAQKENEQQNEGWIRKSREESRREIILLPKVLGSEALPRGYLDGYMVGFINGLKVIPSEFQVPDRCLQ